MIVFDCETSPRGDLVIIGVNRLGKYTYFDNVPDFWQYLRDKKETQIFAHNLEFDFFKVYEYMPEIKFCAYYSTGGLSYIQAGNKFFKDLANHLPFRLADIGDLIGVPKLEIDYDTIEKITPELKRYNKRDCLIEHKAISILKNIYVSEGSHNIKATTGSQAMDIFLKKFYHDKFFKIDPAILEDWRKGYRGGWTQCFISGEFSGQPFYKIDINSLFPYMMSLKMPFPYSFTKLSHLSWRERKYKFWIGMYRDRSQTKAINSVEHNGERADYYYLFHKNCYPFVDWVKYFYAKKMRAKGLRKLSYKKLLVSLYGKFAQRDTLDVVSNYRYQDDNSYISKEPIGEGLDLYKLTFESKFNKYWVNVVWSLFITAKARQYMRNLRRYLINRGIKTYYIDTDSFIVSGDLERIDKVINQDRIGLFKIEDMADSIDIRGKKMYRFGSSLKCKGVPKKYREEFFKNGYVQFKKMVRYKEAIVRGLRLGQWIKTHKTDLKNRRLQRRLL